jgi:glutamyl-tRNA synthetase
MTDMNKSIEKYALANAVGHKGKAHQGAIVGKIIAEFPEAKTLMRDIMPKINKIVADVNKLPYEQQKTKLEKIWPEFFKKEKKVKGLTELPGAVDGKVITRMPPEPGKYMTVGHALSFLINYIYAQKYHGKCVLRFDDTNPNNANQIAVDSFKDGIIRYLGMKPSKVIFATDDMQKMYYEIEKLIKKGQAYACSCPADKTSKLRRKGQACEHRSQDIKTNLEIWKNMLARKYKENEYTIRLIGDMNANNAVLRDPAIARLNYTLHYKHKNKYAVWPLYDLESTCEEEWCGITHVLRDNNFGLERIELQKYLSKILGFKEKTYVQYGRFDIQGLEKSAGRTLRALVAKGANWDDPRMPTLIALERRGFVKETFYELAKQVGLSKTPTKIDEKTLATINRKFIDSIADRYFFVREPVKIQITGNPKFTEIKLKKHPEKQATRTLKLSKILFIEKSDLMQNLGKEIRLKGAYNLLFPKKHGALTTKVDCSSAHPKFGLQVIHWVPKEHIKAEILTTNGKKIKGLAEKNCEKLKVGTVIQFERVGFCKLDKKDKNKLTFVWTHQ